MRLLERENLKRFVCGVFRSRTFLSILPFRPLLKHAPPSTITTFYKPRYQWLVPRFVYLLLLYLLLIFIIVVVLALYVANRTQIDWRYVPFRAIHNFDSTCNLCLLPLLYSGKAPRKQLATKAARKTAQVCSLVTVVTVVVVVAVDNITLNLFLFCPTYIDCHWRC